MKYSIITVIYCLLLSCIIIAFSSCTDKSKKLVRAKLMYTKLDGTQGTSDAITIISVDTMLRVNDTTYDGIVKYVIVE